VVSISNKSTLYGCRDTFIAATIRAKPESERSEAEATSIHKCSSKCSDFLIAWWEESNTAPELSAKRQRVSSTGELNTAPELPAKCQRVWSTGKIEEGHRKEKIVDERHTAHACHKRMKRLLQSCQQNVSAYHPLANSRKDTAKEKRVNDTLLMS
jgi:hypothetical protein